MKQSNEDETMAAEATLIEYRKPGFGRSAWQQTRLVMRLMTDKRVSVFLKALPVAAVAYVLMPFDISPDMVPVLGQLDDLGLFVLGMKMFTDMSPLNVVEEHMTSIREADGYGYLNEAAEDDSPLIIDGEIIEEKSPDDVG